jgi:nitroreductase
MRRCRVAAAIGDRDGRRSGQVLAVPFSVAVKSGSGRSHCEDRDGGLALRTHPTTGFDLDEVERLLTTTKQVRKRLDLRRPVPADVLLEIIEIANHAPMGGNLERNRWLIVTDGDLKAQIAERFAAVGRPYLAANAKLRTDDRSQKVIDSAAFSSSTSPRFRRSSSRYASTDLRSTHRRREAPRRTTARSFRVSGASSSQHERVASARPGRRSTSSTNPRSPNSSASHRPSPRCVFSPSATTAARRSRPPRDGRCGRSRSSTVGSNPSNSGVVCRPIQGRYPIGSSGRESSQLSRHIPPRCWIGARGGEPRPIGAGRRCRRARRGTSSGPPCMAPDYGAA